MDNDWRKQLNAACLDIDSIMRELDRLSLAARVLGNSELSRRLMEMTTQLEEIQNTVNNASDDAFNEYLKCVREGSKNLLQATLTLCKHNYTQNDDNNKDPNL